MSKTRVRPALQHSNRPAAWSRWAPTTSSSRLASRSSITPTRREPLPSLRVGSMLTARRSWQLLSASTPRSPGRASAAHSSWTSTHVGRGTTCAEAGMSPADLDCLELHDATAPAELTLYEDLGLCAAGEGPKLIRANATALGGRIPVNTSGGLIRKGHPIGATGLAQIHELTLQLRGDADTRQVLGARTAMAQNGGGFIKADVATMTLTVLARG